MRILFLSNFFPPFHLGGYEELCAEVRLVLMARGHYVQVLTSQAQHDGEIGEYGIYRSLHTEINYQGRYPGISSLFNASRNLKRDIESVSDVITESKPEIVVVWGIWNLSRKILEYIENLPDIKVVYYIADRWPSLSGAIRLHWISHEPNWVKKVVKLISWRFIKYIFSNALANPVLKYKHVLCASQALRDRLVSDNALPETAEVLSIGIDPAVYQTHELSLSASGYRFLYAGRITPDKGVHTILDAIGYLRKVNINPKLTIIGNGDDEYIQLLTALAKKREISDLLEFHDPVKRDEMPGIYNLNDVLIAPSIEFDTMPRVIQEAMASGLVVIGSNVGGIPEIVQDGVTGLIFPAGDAYKLAETMLWLIENPDQSGKLAQAGHDLVVNKYNIHRMVSCFERYIESTVTS